MKRAGAAPAGSHHVEAFLEMMSAERGAAQNTLAAYRRDLEDYGRFVGPYERAKIGDIRAYLVNLDGRGFAAPSVARRLSAIRQFHRFLFSEGVRGDDPTGTIEGPRKPARLPKVLSRSRGRPADRDGGEPRCARGSRAGRGRAGAAAPCAGRAPLRDRAPRLRTGRR